VFVDGLALGMFMTNHLRAVVFSLIPALELSPKAQVGRWNFPRLNIHLQQCLPALAAH
jgi:hypothetical protein